MHIIYSMWFNTDKMHWQVEGEQKGEKGAGWLWLASAGSNIIPRVGRRPLQGPRQQLAGLEVDCVLRCPLLALTHVHTCG